MLLQICKDGDSMTSLGSLFQRLTTLRVKTFLLNSNLKFPCWSWMALLLVLSPIAHFHPLYNKPLGI